MTESDAREIIQRATALRLAAQNFDTFTVGGESQAQRLVREWLDVCPELKRAEGYVERVNKEKGTPNAKP